MFTKLILVVVPLVTVGVGALTYGGTSAVPLDRVQRTAVEHVTAMQADARDDRTALAPYVSVYRPYSYVSVYRYADYNYGVYRYGIYRVRAYRYSDFRYRDYRYADFPYRDPVYARYRYGNYRYTAYRYGAYRYGTYRYYSAANPAASPDADEGRAE